MSNSEIISSPTKDIRDGNKPYQCTRCDHTLEKEIDLKEHLHSSATIDTSGIDCNESLASELFPCDICSEVFFLHENLEGHIESVYEEKKA